MVVLISFVCAQRNFKAATEEASSAFVERASLNEPLALGASNHTSYFLDSETNATGAARPADQRALERRRAAARALERPYENIALAVPSDAGRAGRRSHAEIVFDDAEDAEDAEVAKELADEGGGEDFAEEEEDEGDFYTSNPADSIKFDLEIVERNKPAVGKKSHFDDFDDFQALNLGSFYEPPDKPASFSAGKAPRKLASRTRQKTRRPPGAEMGRLARASERLGAKKAKLERGQLETLQAGNKKKKKLHRAREFRQEAASNNQDDQSEEDSQRASCALMLESGQCISFAAVERALRRARRLLNFAQPRAGALNSLEPRESTINRVGELVEWATRLLAHEFQLTSEQVHFQLDQLDVSRTSLWRACPRLFRSPLARNCASPVNDPLLLGGRFRSYTGACNNPLQPHLGSSFMPFARLMAADYADGVGAPRQQSSGGPLPPARLVSLQLHPSVDAPAVEHAALFAAWGQLVNHDLALASGARLATGHAGSCCARANSRSPADPLARICAPILISARDPLYGPHGVRCHDFKRSLAALRPGCSLGPRTQLNLVSSFVDGSFVYGATQSAAGALRARTGGRLATWDYFNGRRGRARGRRPRPLKPLLPPQLEAPDEECANRPAGLFCFRSGDARTNQQVPLVVLHTLHVRQHNRLAEALAELNPHWSGGRLFEEARRVHIAQIQHILLAEYLPLLLGERLCQEHNLTETPPGEYWHAYEPAEQPGIAQEFAAAAFRQGHSAVPNQVFRFQLAQDGARRPARRYQLRELFRQPWPLFEPGALDEFTAGLIETAAQTLDPFVSLELAGHLLEEPGEPVGLDLVAINIQRGRDQGVAGYNAAREWCGLEPFSDFEALGSALGMAPAAMMAELYESPDDIDLYSGGLSERPLEGAQVGPTFACIIGRQFRALRAADRHWFEAAPQTAGRAAFTPQQLASIKQFSLARLLCANSDALGAVQASAMQLPHPILNPLLACEQLPDVDLSLWLELAPPPPGRDEADEEDDV